MRFFRLFRRGIAGEARRWVDEKLVTERQARQICGRYGVDYESGRSQTSAYGVLTGLGWLFIGLAVIVLIGGNWDEIPRAVRMTGLILLTLLTQAIALRKIRQGDDRSAAGLFLLGNLFFGASIILIAQIYHLGEHMPDGILWWALGCLPFAVMLVNPWLMLQCLLLSAVWFFTEANYGFYPLLFPLFIVGSGWVLLRGRESGPLFLATVGAVVVWVEYSLAFLWQEQNSLDFRTEHVAVGAALVIFLYLFGNWLKTTDSPVAGSYGATLSAWSLRLGLAGLLVLGFEEPWRELLRARWDHLPGLFGTVAVLIAAAFALSLKTGRVLLPTVLFGGYGATLAALLACGDSGAAVYFQVVSNLVLIAGGVRLVIRGIHSGTSHYFFLGVTVILLTALTRYFDLIGDYLGGALLFAVFAALLLGAARYWKHVQERGAA